MSYEQRLELFAKVVLGGVAILVLIDLGTEFNSKIALRFRWSIMWHVLRYITFGCALALAVDVVSN